MNNLKLLYFELKTGYNDNGPAWIGIGEYSKSKKTIYFNDKAFLSIGGKGIEGSNYIDIESNEEYWISGIKRNQKDSYYGKRNKILIDEKIIVLYLELIGVEKLDKNFEPFTSSSLGNVKERINLRLNESL